MTLLLAACGRGRAPEPPPRSPIQEQLDAQRRSIEAARQEVRAAQDRMNAEAAAAADAVPDSSARSTRP